MRESGQSTAASNRHNNVVKRGVVRTLHLGGGVNSINGSTTFVSTTAEGTEKVTALGINCNADANAIRAALIGQYMLGSDYAASKGKRGGSSKKDVAATTVLVNPAVPGPKVDPKTTEAWLKIEVAKSIRRMRSDFFVLKLGSIKGLTGESRELQDHFEGVFEDYINGEAGDNEVIEFQNPLVSHRHCFLELCQLRHFQFSTLRLAKHSSAMLLYYLHRPNANSLRPRCSNCMQAIRKTRWHCSKDLSEINLCCDCHDIIGPNSSSQFTPYRCTGFSDLEAEDLMDTA